LIFEDLSGFGEALANSLQARGHSSTRVRIGEHWHRGADGTFTVVADNLEHYAQLVSHAQSRPEPFRGIVHAASLDASEPSALSLEQLEHEQTRGVVSVFRLAQALSRIGGTARLWLVTRGAIAEETSPLRVTSATLWGLGRVIALENPDAWGGIIDLDAATLEHQREQEVTTVLDELVRPDGEDQLVYRSGQRRVARLNRSEVPSTTPSSFQVSAEGSYLITGGLGALGIQIAEWLIRQGARKLLLLGRSGIVTPEQAASLPPGHPQRRAFEAVQSFQSQGVQVTVFNGDVADAPRMHEIFDELARSANLRGVIHAAGISIPQTLAEMELECFQSVLRAKVAGAWVLHELTRDLALDFMIYFSSLASVLGSALLGPYAAANHFLDTLAQFRASVGLPATCINWGGWAGEGMTTAEAKSYFERMGLGVIGAQPAFDALARLTAAGAVQTTVAQIDWRRYKPVFEARRRRPLLEQLDAGTEDSARQGKSELVARIERSSPARARAMLLEYVRDEVASVLGLDSDMLEATDGFFQRGMDSLMSVSLRNRLEVGLGRSLPATLAFEHPSVQQLSEFIAGEILLTAEPSSVSGTAADNGSESHDLDAISEEQLVALLAAELSAQPEGRSEP
jgi:myxalamid-type polyketide synthase MxaE and MxaD